MTRDALTVGFSRLPFGGFDVIYTKSFSLTLESIIVVIFCVVLVRLGFKISRLPSPRMFNVYANLDSLFTSWLATSTLSPMLLAGKLFSPWRRLEEFLMVLRSFFTALMYLMCDGSWYFGSLVGDHDLTESSSLELRKLGDLG